MPEINLLPDQVNLTFGAGQDVAFDITVTDHLGAPVTLFNATAGMGRTATVAGSLRPAPALDTQVTGNVVTVRLSSALSLRAQNGFWQMAASAGGQPARALVSGTVTVRR
jgi:hypothetical protein